MVAIPMEFVTMTATLNGFARNGHHATNGNCRLRLDDSPLTTHHSPIAPWPAPIPFDDLPAPAPYPIDVLHPSLQEFVIDGAPSLNVPIDFLAVAMLAVAGGAVGNIRRVHINDDWFESTCLYVCSIGDPGVNKSATLGRIMRPIADAEERYETAFNGARALWCNGGCQGEGPTQRQLSIPGGNDTTEGIIRLVKENHRGLIYANDELRGLTECLNQYKSTGRGSDKSFFLKAWDQKPFSYTRRGKEASFKIRSPFLSTLGFIQPDLVPTLAGPVGQVAQKDGFFDRFLLSFPITPEEKPYDFAEVNAVSQQAWTNTIAELLSWTGKNGDDRTPEICTLSRDARRRYHEFTVRHVEEVTTPGFDKYLKSAWKKLRGGYCMRLALVLHCLDSARDGCFDSEISGDCLSRAIALIDYFKSHAKRVRALMQQSRRDPEIAEVWESIRDKAAKSGELTFKESDLFDRLRRRFRHREGALPKILKSIAAHYLIRPIERAAHEVSGRGGAPPGAVYDINPRALHNEDDSPTLFDSVDKLSPTGLAEAFVSVYRGFSDSFRDIDRLAAEFAQWIDRLDIDSAELFAEITRDDRDTSEPPWEIKRRLAAATTRRPDRLTEGLDAYRRLTAERGASERGASAP